MSPVQTHNPPCMQDTTAIAIASEALHAGSTEPGNYKEDDTAEKVDDSGLANGHLSQLLLPMDLPSGDDHGTLTTAHKNVWHSLRLS